MYTNPRYDAFRKRYKELFPLLPVPTDQQLDWLIGFVEGDGSFAAGKKTLAFVIDQGEANLIVLERIISFLGFGKPSYKVTRGMYTLQYGSNDIIELFILLFNGNLVLPTRKIKFQRFLDAWNAKNPNRYIEFIEGDRLPTLCDTWLVGFTEAEGSFYCSFQAMNQSAKPTYSIAQKGLANYPIFVEFTKLLPKGSLEKRKNSEFIEFRVRGITNIPSIYNYFDANLDNFLGIKKDCYLRFKEVHQLLVDKAHLDPATRASVIAKAQAINGTYSHQNRKPKSK